MALDIGVTVQLKAGGDYGVITAFSLGLYTVLFLGPLGLQTGMDPMLLLEPLFINLDRRGTMNRR